MKLERRNGAPGGETQEQRQEPSAPRYSRKREISVIIYTTVLFVVALALIGLSYGMQHRTNAALTDITRQHGETMKNLEELQRENETLQKKLEAAQVLSQLLNTDDAELRQALLRRMDDLEPYLDGENLDIYKAYVANIPEGER